MADGDGEAAKKKRQPRRGRQAVTVHDVARHAGFSSMTVSRVINRKSTVAEAIRLKVEESIAALNFVPSNNARSLASARSMRVGYPYTNPRATYNGEVLIGVLDEASRAGIQLLLERSYEGSEVDAVERLLLSGVDGMILLPRLARNTKVMKLIVQASIAFISISEIALSEISSAVIIDDFEAARLATNYLIGLGHRRIGFVAGPSALNTPAERKRGFLAALQQHELTDAGIEPGYYTFEAGMHAAEALLSQASRPTAIVAANDDMAAGALSGAYNFGLHVPRELSIIGFDDTPVCTTVWPNLSTVAMPLTEMAKAAVEILVGQISARQSGHEMQPEIRVFPFSLVKRGSTGPADS